ncbi:hypothetical protein Plhal304r1_c055g0140431 [Plasmopara halstedii]
MAESMPYHLPSSKERFFRLLLEEVDLCTLISLYALCVLSLKPAWRAPDGCTGKLPQESNHQFWCSNLRFTDPRRLTMDASFPNISGFFEQVLDHPMFHPRG